MNVTVKVTALSAALIANRTEHLATYGEAITRYQEKVIEDLEGKLARLKAGEKLSASDLTVRLPVPEEHTADFDRVIRMLEMAVDDTIELTESQFSEYVMNEWNWQRSFTTNTASYTTR